MDDFPRRRRLQPQEPKKGGGIPIFPLVVLVIFAGLLLGGALAKFFGHSPALATPAPTFTPLPSPAPTSAPRATPHRSASPSPSTSPSKAPSPTPSASSAPKGTPSASPARATATAAPSVIYITPQPKASVVKTLAPRTPAPRSPTPSVVAAASPTPTQSTAGSTSGRPASIVRAYLAAVLRGDEATATGYLSRGLPNESFYTGASKITDVETTHNADGSYTVAVDITAPTGEYYETFKLAEGPGGLCLQIVDHYAIKVQ